MEHLGVYLYGFVPDGSSLDLSGIEGVEGVRPIRSVEIGGSTAVVGEIPLDVFEAAMSAGRDGGPDPSWVVPRVLRHHAVLEAVLSRSLILPVRFGTLFSSPDALAALAGTHRGTIAGFFETIGDRQEWSLRGYFDPSRAIELVLEHDPDLSSRRLALPKSAGVRYFQEKKLREEAGREAKRSASEAAKGVRQALRSITDDARSVPLRRAEAPDREMVLHEVFLLSFEMAEQALILMRTAAEERFQGLLTLEPSGPWPPCYFCPQLEGPST